VYGVAWLIFFGYRVKNQHGLENVTPEIINDLIQPSTRNPSKNNPVPQNLD